MGFCDSSKIRNYKPTIENQINETNKNVFACILCNRIKMKLILDKNQRYELKHSHKLTLKNKLAQSFQKELKVIRTNRSKL